MQIITDEVQQDEIPRYEAE